MSELFSPLTVRDVTFRNRLGISPMCQYQGTDGLPSDWHAIHLGSRAVGGAGMVMMEATGVSPEARITPACLGLWNDAQAEALAPLAAMMKGYGTVPAIQIAHAGRKGSATEPWNGGAHIADDAQDGWPVRGPSAIPFDPDGTRLFKTPTALSVADIAQIQTQFVESAKRAVDCGFELIEIHAAHGYLLHSFLSPLSNQRDDDYGGTLANRARLLLEITEKTRAIMPEGLPLSVRLSVTDWDDDGQTVEQSVEVARWLKERGVDFIDCSSGGNVPRARNSMRDKGAQQPELAGRLRQAVGIKTMAVGEITTAQRAEEVASEAMGDLVLVARQSLRDPYLPYTWARELGIDTKGLMPNPNDFFVG